MEPWGGTNRYTSASSSKYGNPASHFATSNRTPANQKSQYKWGKANNSSTSNTNSQSYKFFQKGELSGSPSESTTGSTRYVGSGRHSRYTVRRNEEVPPSDTYRKDGSSYMPPWKNENNCSSRNDIAAGGVRSLPAATRLDSRRNLFDIDYEAETGNSSESGYGRRPEVKLQDDSLYKRDYYSGKRDEAIDRFARDLNSYNVNYAFDIETACGNNRLKKNLNYVAETRLEKRGFSPDWRHVDEHQLKKQNIGSDKRHQNPIQGDYHSWSLLSGENGGHSDGNHLRKYDYSSEMNDYKSNIQLDWAGGYRHVEETDSSGSRSFYTEKNWLGVKDNAYSKMPSNAADDSLPYWNKKNNRRGKSKRNRMNQLKKRENFSYKGQDQAFKAHLENKNTFTSKGKKSTGGAKIPPKEINEETINEFSNTHNSPTGGTLPKNKNSKKKVSKKKKNKAQQLASLSRMVLKKRYASKLMNKDGVAFLETLSKQTKLKMYVDKQTIQGDQRYVCVFQGPYIRKSEAQAAVERFLYPLGTREVIKSLPFKNNCSVSSLMQNLELVDNSDKFWTHLASLRYHIVQKKEKFLKKSRISKGQLKLAKEVRRNYSVLNAMILGKLDVADGPKHMRILRQWLEQDNNHAMSSTIEFSFNYVFNSDSALDIDYPDVIKRFCNDEKLTQKLMIRAMHVSGVDICRAHGWTEQMKRHKDLYRVIIIENYSVDSIEQFVKNHDQLKAKAQSLKPVVNSCENAVNDNRDGGDHTADIDCTNLPASQTNIAVTQTNSDKGDVPNEINQNQVNESQQAMIDGESKSETQCLPSAVGVPPEIRSDQCEAVEVQPGEKPSGPEASEEKSLKPVVNSCENAVNDNRDGSDHTADIDCTNLPANQTNLAVTQTYSDKGDAPNGNNENQVNEFPQVVIDGESKPETQCLPSAVGVPPEIRSDQCEAVEVQPGEKPSGPVASEEKSLKPVVNSCENAVNDNRDGGDHTADIDCTNLPANQTNIAITQTYSDKGDVPNGNNQNEVNEFPQVVIDGESKPETQCLPSAVGVPSEIRSDQCEAVEVQPGEKPSGPVASEEKSLKPVVNSCENAVNDNRDGGDHTADIDCTNLPANQTNIAITQTYSDKGDVPNGNNQNEVNEFPQVVIDGESKPETQCLPSAVGVPPEIRSDQCEAVEVQAGEKPSGPVASDS